MKNETLAVIFGNNPYVSLDERARIIHELEKIGSLTFRVETHEDGWVAQCNEVSGILASNTNPNPTGIEIESQIRDAIFAAFNVKFDKKQEISNKSTFEYSFGK